MIGMVLIFKLFDLRCLKIFKLSIYRCRIRDCASDSDAFFQSRLSLAKAGCDLTLSDNNLIAVEKTMQMINQDIDCKINCH